jgi:hypothetical protein
MKSLVNRLNNAIKLSGRQKKLVLTVFWLSIYRNILLYKGDKASFTEHICKKQDPTVVLTAEKILIAKDIALAITIVNKYLPWKNVCRHQSWQAVRLLLKYQIPFKYTVGVQKTKIIREGHSWVKVSNKFVCGSCDEKEFFIIC